MWIATDGAVAVYIPEESISEDLADELETGVQEMVMGNDLLVPPAGSFASISVGVSHGCGVKLDGSVACWGDNQFGQASPPEGTFGSVSAGSAHTCGLLTEGSVVCWGLNKDNEGNVGGQASPPDGTFLSISAGGAHTCGLRRDGAIACWGLGSFGQSTPPF